MSKKKAPRVGVKPTMYQGSDGYRVQWVDDSHKVRRFFVLSRSDAAYVKRRAKAGKLPGASVWAVKF